MKRIPLILVLLVTFTLVTAPVFAPVAFAGDRGEIESGSNGGRPGTAVTNTADAEVDQSGEPVFPPPAGDPGAAGDGFGCSGDPSVTTTDSVVNGGSGGLGAYINFVMSLVRLAI